MVHLAYKVKIVNKRIAHNLTWIPIFLIGILTISLGVVCCTNEQPWFLYKSLNEALLQTSFDVLLSEKINIGLPSYLKIVYRFLGLYMLTIGFLIIGYVYITRLGTKIARNCIFLILFVTLNYSYVFSQITTNSNPPFNSPVFLVDNYLPI